MTICDMPAIRIEHMGPGRVLDGVRAPDGIRYGDRTRRRGALRYGRT